ncbi:MAG: hypothetical protein R3C02_14300 [Planctomycetaceae bacterium]
MDGRELNELREAWLNPPEWVRTEVLEFPGSTDGPWKRYIDPDTVESGGMLSRRQAGEHVRADTEVHGDPADAVTPCHPTGAIGTVKYPRLVPKDEDCAKQLKKRTLTNLYNERPTWLDLAHKKLDAAVFAAYGWDPAMSDDDLLAALLALNLERANAS